MTRVTALLGVLFMLQAQGVAVKPPLVSATAVRAVRTAAAPLLDGQRR